MSVKTTRTSITIDAETKLRLDEIRQHFIDNYQLDINRSQIIRTAIQFYHERDLCLDLDEELDR